MYFFQTRCPQCAISYSGKIELTIQAEKNKNKIVRQFLRDIVYKIPSLEEIVSVKRST